MSDFPYSQTKMLVNSIEASTTVSIVDGMQVSNTKFTSPAGDFGSVQLSPVTSYATDIKFAASQQELHIEKIEFRAAFGLDTGQVTVSGKATNQTGGDWQTFSTTVASWTAPS